jgi:hypothetical protein
MKTMAAATQHEAAAAEALGAKQKEIDSAQVRALPQGKGSP